MAEMSAFVAKAHVAIALQNVRFGSEADISRSLSDLFPGSFLVQVYAATMPRPKPRGRQ